MGNIKSAWQYSRQVAFIGTVPLLTVLIQAQRAAGVLDKEVEQADFVVSDLGDRRQDVVGDEIRAARLGGQRKVLLGPGHDAGA